MNSNDRYVEDDDELVFTGKQVREYRDICRKEGSIKAYKDILKRINNLNESVGAMPLNKYLKKKIKELKGVKK
jgi:hypothetical protein